MPNVLTHKLFAEETQKIIRCETLKPYLEAWPEAFWLGSSGPDFFFYYNVWNWRIKRQKEPVAKLGNLVHNEKINEFYRYAMTVVKNETNELKKGEQIAYLAGHLCHWALDSIAHPYVFYFAGAPNRENRFWHYRLESMIDTLMLERLRQKSIASIKGKEILPYDAKLLQAVSGLYVPVMKQVFDKEVSHAVVHKSIRDFSDVLQFLFDPTGKRFASIQNWERRFKQEWALSSHLVTPLKDHEHDILNLKHRSWHEPAYPECVHQESFLELFNQALARGADCLNALNQWLEGSRENLDDLLQDRTYETGKSGDKEMTCFGKMY